MVDSRQELTFLMINYADSFNLNLMQHTKRCATDILTRIIYRKIYLDFTGK